MKHVSILLSALFMILVQGCSSPEEDPDADYADGINIPYDTKTSDEFNEDNANNPELVNQCTPKLLAVVRDFSDDHPDFHHSGEIGKAGSDLVTGMVQVDLGPDGKPMIGTADFYSTHLDQWYYSIPNINKEFIATIPLTDIEGDGIWSHDSDAFFPLGPNQGFGAEGLTDGQNVERNFLFTTEISLRFTYKEGQRFRFKGDDDLWVFINGKLAIDLGGIHSEQEQEVDIDAHAQKYGMLPGNEYTMHIFHAERNPVESHFRIETNIECFTSVGVVV